MMSLILTTLFEMIDHANDTTSLLLFIPLTIAVIGFHIGSKNSTANGLIVGGITAFGTGMLFYTLSSSMLLIMQVGLMVTLVGLATLYFFNKNNKWGMIKWNTQT